LNTFKGHERTVMGIRMVYDEVKKKRFFVSVGHDKRVKIWDFY